MIKKMTSGCIKLVQRYLPDPFLFALILSAIVFILGIALNGETPLSMVQHWGAGFWGFLAFSMQMVLVVVLGNCLANAPVFKKLLVHLAGMPRSPKQAIMLCTVVAGIATMIQWGFGLVIGAVFAKELAKRVRGVDYRLLIAAAYSTFMLSVPTSSIILKAASNPNELVVTTGGALTEVVDMTRTAYFPLTLATLVIMFIGLVILNAAMHPTPEETFCIDPRVIEEDEQRLAAEEAAAHPDKKNMTPAERIENSIIVSGLVGLAGIVYLVYYFATNGFSMNIDIMNFMLFIFGIILHKTPIAYIRAFGNAVKSSAGIVLQFPFYAGIVGMMTTANANGISLAGIITEGIVSLSNKTTYPLFTFLSASLVNMFVPSAGGQFSVQAPVMYPAGAALKVDPAITTVALTWGDTWTNMIQPFWALPALGIAGLKVRDIMGYCVMVLIFTGVIIVGSLLIWTAIT